jgi:hypothetical protein
MCSEDVNRTVTFVMERADSQFRNFRIAYVTAIAEGLPCSWLIYAQLDDICGGGVISGCFRFSR